MGRDAETDDFYEMEFDLAECCAKLRCTEEDLLVNGVWMVRDADGYLTSANYDSMYGFFFDENGLPVTEMDAATFTAGYSEDGTMRAYIVDDANLENEYHAVLYVSFNDRYYAFNITIGGEATAIKSLDADVVKAASIYDLSGREVSSPSKGIYIRDGKKFIVK